MRSALDELKEICLRTSCIKDREDSLSEETRRLLNDMAKKWNDSLQEKGFVTGCFADSFFKGFLEQGLYCFKKSKTQKGIRILSIPEFIRLNACNGYYHCGFSLEETMNYVEATTGIKPSVEYLPFFWLQSQSRNGCNVVVRDEDTSLYQCSFCSSLLKKGIVESDWCKHHNKDSEHDLCGECCWSKMDYVFSLKNEDVEKYYSELEKNGRLIDRHKEEKDEQDQQQRDHKKIKL